MQIIILVLHVLVALAILGLVLVQQGKGADIGAAFGSGASNTMFGSAGSTSFLMKVTIVLATIFFCTSLGLDYMAAHNGSKASRGILNLPTTSNQMVMPVPTFPQAGPVQTAAPTAGPVALTQTVKTQPVKIITTKKTTNQE
jgi:preprotein translocase subunit SecG